VRSVKRWCDDDQSTDRFGLTVAQFRAYRQTGIYGGYRVAFHKWPGMTEKGDGWTPGKGTKALAKWLDKKLGAARPPRPLHAGDGDAGSFPKPDKRSRGKEHEWWRRQWRTFEEGGRIADENTLPRRTDYFERLSEADLLKPLIFGNDDHGKRRLKVACEVAKSEAADHIGVCEHLGRVFASDPIFVLLPHFSRLADAGMAVMDLVAKSLQNEVRVELVDLAARPEAAPICEALMAATRKWREKTPMHMRHVATADRFADAIRSARPVECFRALLPHHEMHGGGLPWFVLHNGGVELSTSWHAGSSLYRFRLWPLCRLATQCGVLRKMPRALLGVGEAEDDETSEAADE